ncbi:hypothetical protein D7B24_007772 [Verticillium nonalfalfae]|uniref:Pseudouridine synthase RsuA/RluA-like domain-containing protein n=1 Tax=Verticillium nonalfalfae TaxID=1051616 RepID=A0A3M9Y6H5_9PEZI|nr:uncharacterized protein D7B24_007772 [Verticillium nonalfalfae]RNJ56103.1 hypothetical protein D7B24_007772 [Verticillium nonalfalfae]
MSRGRNNLLCVTFVCCATAPPHHAHQPVRPYKAGTTPIIKVAALGRLLAPFVRLTRSIVASPMTSTSPPDPVPSQLAMEQAEAAQTALPPARKTEKKQKKRKPDHGNALPDTIITPLEGPWPRPYVIEDGLRKVEPYYHTFNTYCKERWRGRTLIDVFSCEFRDRTPEYYRKCMDDGKIAANGKVVGADYVIRNGDLVSHTSHRHEPPVTAEPIAVIHEDNDYLIVNKPAGVPVHPAGRYNFNSVVEILKSERGAHFMPRPCHRLDRLTSGILCFGKTAQAATDLSRQIQARMVRKEYVARVIGHFPDGEVVCDQPLLQISPRLGLNRVRANGKFARTVFKRLAYYPPPLSDVDGGPEQRPKTPEEAADEEQRPWTAKKGYSIVRCLPLTGRTHQIRVHLQFLGYPIQNDPIYANQRVWGFDLGCNDDGTTHTDEDIMSRLEKMGKEEVADAVAYHEEMVDLYHKRRAEKLSGELCKTCDTPLYTDPGDQELSLFLHSLRYEDSGGEWSYCSPLPPWALPPSGMSGPTAVGGLGELVEAVKDDPIDLTS